MWESNRMCAYAKVSFVYTHLVRLWQRSAQWLFSPIFTCHLSHIRADLSFSQCLFCLPDIDCKSTLWSVLMEQQQCKNQEGHCSGNKPVQAAQCTRGEGLTINNAPADLHSALTATVTIVDMIKLRLSECTVHGGRDDNEFKTVFYMKSFWLSMAKVLMWCFKVMFIEYNSLTNVKIATGQE